MNSLLQYLDHIPNVPSNLIDEIYKSIESPPITVRFRHNSSNYKIYNVNEQLEAFLRPFFPAEYTLRIHVLKDKLAIHKDFGRTRAFNYIIESGGCDAETCFYDDNFKLIEKHKIDKFRWHQIDVTRYHSVINMAENRIAITIYIEEETPGGLTLPGTKALVVQR